MTRPLSTDLTPDREHVVDSLTPAINRLDPLGRAYALGWLQHVLTLRDATPEDLERAVDRAAADQARRGGVPLTSPQA